MISFSLARLVTIGFFLIAASIGAAWLVMVRMPGASFEGAPPPLTNAEQILRAQLRADVQKLAGEIGSRNLARPPSLPAAADFIADSFRAAGLSPRRQSYEVAGKLCQNIEVQIAGASPAILVIGAHYDSVPGSPGANDNASGVAALLALARAVAASPVPPAYTLRLVAFANEEAGYFQTEAMGSWVYAHACRARGDQIAGMISLETVGYFSRQPASQHYPVPGLNLFYPSAGDFIAFVSNVSSRALLREVLGRFREHATLPSQGAALPASIPGVGWSDQWAFWEHGFPALMITDTAPFRYPHYHRSTDTPEQLDYEAMARLVSALEKVLLEITPARR